MASNVAVRYGHVAFLNSAGVLIVLTDTDGATVLSSTPTGAVPAESRVILTKVGDKQVAVVAQDAAITAWDLASQDPQGRQSAIAPGSLVTSGGSGLMVTAGGQTLRLAEHLGMEEVQALPAGNTSLGLTGDGRIVSGSAAGGWALADGTTATPVSPVMLPQGIESAVYPAQASKGYVAAWAPTGDPAARAVGLYDAISGEAVASTTMPTEQVNLGLRLTVADGGTLAAIGPWLINIEKKTGKAVAGWSTTIGTATALYGAVGDAPHVWGGEGDPEPLGADVALPWGLTQAGNAVIVTAENSKKALAAIKPA